MKGWRAARFETASLQMTKHSASVMRSALGGALLLGMGGTGFAQGDRILPPMPVGQARRAGMP